MALKPDASLMAGLAVAGVVYGVYSNALPSVADVRAAQPNNADISAAERSATWISLAVVSGVSLIAKDPTIFILGGSMVVALAWWHRHADMVIPELGMAVPKYTNESNQVDADNMRGASNYDYSTQSSEYDG